MPQSVDTKHAEEVPIHIRSHPLQFSMSRYGRCRDWPPLRAVAGCTGRAERVAARRTHRRPGAADHAVWRTPARDAIGTSLWDAQRRRQTYCQGSRRRNWSGVIGIDACTVVQWHRLPSGSCGADAHGVVPQSLPTVVRHEAGRGGRCVELQSIVRPVVVARANLPLRSADHSGGGFREPVAGPKRIGAVRVVSCGRKPPMPPAKSARWCRLAHPPHDEPPPPSAPASYCRTSRPKN